MIPSYNKAKDLAKEILKDRIFTQVIVVENARASYILIPMIDSDEFNTPFREAVRGLGGRLRAKVSLALTLKVEELS